LFLLGEEAVASPSIEKTLWRVWTMFTRPAITLQEVNRFGWNLEHSGYIVWRWPWQILGAIWAEARAGERAEAFLSGKQRTILPTSGQPNFTKFIDNTWIWEVVNPFGKHFRKFARKGSFFQKGQLLRELCQRLPTLGRDICEMITNLGKSRLVDATMECWFSICTVGINSVIPLDCRARCTEHRC